MTKCRPDPISLRTDVERIERAGADGPAIFRLPPSQCNPTIPLRLCQFLREPKETIPRPDNRRVCDWFRLATIQHAIVTARASPICLLDAIPAPASPVSPGSRLWGEVGELGRQTHRVGICCNRPVAFVIITDVDLRLESVLSHVRGHPHPISPPRPCVPPASRSWAKVASSGGAGVARGAGYRCRC